MSDLVQKASEKFLKTSLGLNGVNIKQITSNSFGVNGLVTITTTSTVVSQANSKRLSISVQNEGTQPVLLKVSGLDPSIGDYSCNLAPASGIRIGDGGVFYRNDTNGEIRGIVESGTSVVSVLEVISE